MAISAGAILGQGAAVRLVFGLCALAEPEAASRLLGAPRSEINRSGSHALRLFAARDVALGLATATASSGGRAEQRRAVLANLAAEAADSAALAFELRDRQAINGTAVAGALFNIAGYATWLAAARALRRKSTSAEAYSAHYSA